MATGGRISKRSLGTKPAGGNPNGAGGARINETRASVPKGSSTRGFTPPGAKTASGKAVVGQSGRQVAGLKGSTGSPKPTKTIRSS